MNSLKIESTTFTPEINFDIANNTLSFLKVSKPANAIDFYGPVFEFIDNFEKSKVKSKVAKELVIDFNFDYFNTATAKIIYELLDRFKKIQKQGVNIIINWYYHPDDEDQLEEGQIMSEALDMPFQYIPLEEDNIIE
jgi:SiaC family regulatory phosphoprotein